MRRALSFEGDLDLAKAEEIEAALGRLEPGGGGVTVDLRGLDVFDGPALARAISALRLLARHGPLLLVGAPQLLAHTLYKVGALEGPRGIQLSEAREEEPYG